MEELKFKISSALKDIIGRDLITDDNIAVFELVKNAYDAYATRVDITFENIYSENSRIIIKDNGKGMSLQDIKNKWLFVAYSAKKEGTEDESFDYRDSIYQKRAFAGAKGIGRFSCDRLGKELLLESTKKENDAKTEIIVTDWRHFEQDLKDEFVDVTVAHETRNESNYGLKHGTVLEISDLRSEWSRDKLLRLKRSLAKLINPAYNSSNQKFKIFLNVPEEYEKDTQEDDYNDIVNGEIQNLIFETLEIKTTLIESSVSESGQNVSTRLTDGGTLIYEIKETNAFPKLKGVQISIFYLNQSAKMTFARRMGLSSKEYGHIFVFKNGFRVYPYGETGEDPFKVDVRKAQGYARNLGNREIIGQINVNTSDIELKETTSRGDGFIKNSAYLELEEYFWQTLKRLEKYVVDVQKWGLNIDDLDEQNDKEFKQRVVELIGNLTGTSELIDFDYGTEFLKLIKEAQSDSTEQILSNLEELASNEKDEKLLAEVKKVQSELAEIRRSKQFAEKELREEEKKRRVATEELEEKETENLFLKSVKSQDFDEIISLLHHIGISASKIENYLTGLLSKIKRRKDISSDEIANWLTKSIFEISKVLNISKFATKANFKLYTDAIELDLDQYLKEYVNNFLSLSVDDRIEIVYENENKGSPLIKKVRPIEINILIDNMLSNSKKANATKFIIRLVNNNNNYSLLFIDNGDGIPPTKLDKIFNYGYTTTSQGSGIGLYHVNEVIRRIGAEISVSSDQSKGTTFKIYGL